MTGILRRSAVLLTVCTLLLGVSASAASGIEWGPDAETQQPDGEIRGSGAAPSSGAQSQPQAPRPPTPDPVQSGVDIAVATPVPAGPSAGAGRSYLNVTLLLGGLAAVALAVRRFA